MTTETTNCSFNTQQTDWVTMNFVPFAERSMSMVVSLYQKTSNWQEVIEAHVLKNIIQVRNAWVTSQQHFLVFSLCCYSFSLLVCVVLGQPGSLLSHSMIDEESDEFPAASGSVLLATIR